MYSWPLPALFLLAVGTMPLTISSLDRAVRSAADLDLFERQARWVIGLLG